MKDIAYTNPESIEKEIPFVITGEIISGTEVLAQRVITMLCTDVQEILRSSEGTTMLSNLGNGNSQDTVTKMLITAAASNVLRSIKQSEDSDTNDSERLSDIAVTNVVCNGDSVSCTITVTNALSETTSTDTTYTL